MNTQKYSIGNCGLFSEADRTMYKDKDTVSRSLIDKTKTHLNYNLCRHPQYSQRELKNIHEKIRGKKLRKDAVAFGSTIVSLPKDFSGDTELFFRETYRALKAMYKLREEDIISAYVHMDESTPHMHFYFIPVYREKEKVGISWDKVFPRVLYKKQHKELQEHLEMVFGFSVNLLNGATLGVGDINKLTEEQKIRGLEAQKQTAHYQNEALDMYQKYKLTEEKLSTLEESYQAKELVLEASYQAKEKKLRKKLETIYEMFEMAMKDAKLNISKLFTKALTQSNREEYEANVARDLRSADRYIREAENLMEDEDYER